MARHGLNQLKWRLNLHLTNKQSISADPGRRKGERVREEEVLPCYYYYYSYSSSSSYYYY